MKRKQNSVRDAWDAEMLFVQRWFTGMAVAGLVCLALAILGVFG